MDARIIVLYQILNSISDVYRLDESGGLSGIVPTHVRYDFG
jgi:hypothetical protein